MKLKTVLFGRTYKFKDLNEVQAKASEQKSGDELAGLAATSKEERAAAKIVLADMLLSDIRDHPAVPYEIDDVTRVIQDQVNEAVYKEIRNWTVGEFRDFLMQYASTGPIIQRIATGLTSEMIAAVTKIMSNMDLIYVAKKIDNVATCVTTIGNRGIAANRALPNHPTDDIDAIFAELYEALAYGVGDAMLGLNPVQDTVESTTFLLHKLYEFRMKWEIPTQNCVLSHITTQMAALRKGAPLDMIFQSIAGTQKANESFGVTTALLDEAYDLGKRECISGGKNIMYFETGEGSELSADAHMGVDMLTLEARTYGYGRHYDPFYVMSVVGFIGPEYIYDSVQQLRAGLEEHFMGTLSLFPMGVDVCYTNHMPASQNDSENLALLLAHAGMPAFVTAPMGDDIMLNYQLLGNHDWQTLLELSGMRRIPEFEKWLQKMEILDENCRFTEKAGDASIFLK